jgi:hypothetical protein
VIVALRTLSSSWRVIAIAVSLLMLSPLGWASFAPMAAGSREQVFEIPPGTHARRMSGAHIDILPQTIRLTLTVRDVLVFRNSDTAPHIFGPALIMPGQSFSLPFAAASTYSFQCTAHANGQLSVIVDPAPTPGWQRLRWRWRTFAEG